MSDPELPEAARAFVEGDVELLPAALSADEGARLVELLRARGDAERLARLGDAADKALAKQARRALHLLRARGVKAPPPRKREFRPAGPHASAEELSLASTIDGRGERIVWLVRSAPDGFDVFEAQLSDTRGLLGFTAAHAPRREWRQHAARVVGDERLAVGRISERHARALVEQGYQRTLAAGRVPPEEFARARLSLGHFEPEAEHPSLALAPPLPLDEARGRLASLHELPELRTWIPPEELLPELDLAIGNIATSKLVIDPAQRREQLAEIDKLADRALDAPLRARYVERLRESAYLLAVRGKLEAARLASTAAALTADEGVAGRENPFVVQLFAKVVRQSELERTDDR
jgi:hypothetical protein